MSSSDNVYDWLIIGGGVSGSSLSHFLTQRGQSVVLLEKSRGLGGRVCSRRTPHGPFLHGATSFTAESPEFQKAIHDFVQRGIISRWNGSFGVIDEQHQFRFKEERNLYKVYPKTQVFCAEWAKEAQVYLQHRVNVLHRQEHWVAQTEHGTTFRAKSLVLSAPTPQSIRLLPREIRSMFAAPKQWNRSTTVLIRFQDEYPLFSPDLCAVTVQPTALDKAVSQDSLHDRSTRKNWTFLLNDAWSTNNWKCSLLDSVQQVFVELDTLDFPIPPAPEYCDVHFWKFGGPTQKLTSPQWYPELQLGFVGEAYHSAQVEGAFLSSLQLLSALDQ